MYVDCCLPRTMWQDFEGSVYWDELAEICSKISRAAGFRGNMVYMYMYYVHCIIIQIYMYNVLCCTFVEKVGICQIRRKGEKE